MTVLLSPVIRWWKCPSCGNTDRTESADAHTRMHPCPMFGNMALPLVEVQNPDDRPDAQHVIVEREDYARDPYVDRIAAIRTDHGDGSNDCTVLAPTARVHFVL